jgi:hypothetical protein
MNLTAKQAKYSKKGGKQAGAEQRGAANNELNHEGQVCGLTSFFCFFSLKAVFSFSSFTFRPLRGTLTLG